MGSEFGLPSCRLQKFNGLSQSAGIFQFASGTVPDVSPNIENADNMGHFDFEEVQYDATSSNPDVFGQCKLAKF
jgi:hypothetical protein